MIASTLTESLQFDSYNNYVYHFTHSQITL